MAVNRIFALAHYREAVRLRPDFGKAHLDPGSVLAAQHDVTAAAEEFRKAAGDTNPEVRQMAQQARQGLQSGGSR